MARTMKDSIKPVLSNPKFPNKTKKITKTVEISHSSPKKVNDELCALTSRILKKIQQKVLATSTTHAYSHSKKSCLDSKIATKNTSHPKVKTLKPQIQSSSTLRQRNLVLGKQKLIVKKLLRSGKEFGTYFLLQNDNVIIPKVAVPLKARIFQKMDDPAKKQINKPQVHINLLDSPQVIEESTSCDDSSSLNKKNYVNDRKQPDTTSKFQKTSKHITIKDDSPLKETPKKANKVENTVEKREREVKQAIGIPEVKPTRIDRRKRCEIQVEQLDRPKERTVAARASTILMEVDIVFCCDTTSGMGEYLSSTIDQIAAIYQKTKPFSEVIDVKYGFVCYRDHPPEEDGYVVKVFDLSSPLKVVQFIEKQRSEGGGDTPEAVMDGLFAATTKISWRRHSHKYIFHIADAPPHGDVYTGVTGGFLNRSFVWKEGCPCGLSIEIIAPLMNNLNIHYRLIKAGANMERMAQIFKSCIDHYADVKVDSPEGLDFIFADLIAKQCLTAAKKILEQQKQQENWS